MSLPPVFLDLPDTICDAVRPLADEPLQPVAALVAEVVDYRRHILAVAAAEPHVHIELAEALATASLNLLTSLDRDADPTTRKIAQIAVRYFVLEDDGDGDLTSVTGLDDDRQVFNIAVRALGRPDLIVELP